MKRNTLFSFLTVAALGLLTAGPVSAADQTWDGCVSTDWDNRNNWVGNAVPGSGDTATIPDAVSNNDPLIDSSVSIGNLMISNGAVVTISGATLTMDDTTASDIDGDLVLSDSTAVLKFTASVTVDGDGNIIGQHDAAELQIKGGKTLTNEMIVKGQMTVKKDATAGTATFHNGATGTVEANVDGGFLTFASDVALADSGSCSAAVFAATVDNAKLIFNASATGLTALFYLDNCGVFELANGVNIATTNILTDGAGGDPEGCLELVGSGSFKYAISTCDGNQITRDEDHSFGGCSCP